MAIKISKPSDSVNEKAKLTKTGKLVLICVAIIALASAVFFLSSSNKNKKLDELRGELTSAVEIAVTKCKSSVKATGATDADIKKVDAFEEEIANEKDAVKKSSLAKDCIAFVLPLAEGNSRITDELNGAQNRILIAEKNLNSYSN